MSVFSGDRDPIEVLADSFLARFRRGERPSVEDYAAQHPDLADEIRELLPALVMLERDKPAVGPDTATDDGRHATASGPTPQQLGDYLIVREIGRGGMGVVYEAVQHSLGRHVALKVLPNQALAGSSQLARFQLEARAAARLHHTNVVPVFGVGECEGVHYYAMQFIVGQALDVVIDALQGLRSSGGPVIEAGSEIPGKAGGVDPTLTAAVTQALLTGQFAAPQPEPRLEPAATPTETDALTSPPPSVPAGAAPSDRASDLPTNDAGLSSELSSSAAGTPFYRSVARVGVQVAEALAHAHGHGVLHRDIKPSNLLLDAGGNVWVTDFGLAKAEGSDGLTRTGDIVGTLRYMAPERFDGWSDPRSDVYALGATLYELLTLRPPFQESNRVKLIEQVLHEEPVPPQRLDRRIPRDLETIVLKALSKEPGQRYSTAEQMAEDLRRFAADRPILARRFSTAEIAWRWCKRNPMLAGAVGAVAAALVAVATISMIYATEQARANGEITRLAGNLQDSLAESNRLLATRNFDRGQTAFEKGEIGSGMLWMIESWRSAIKASDPVWQEAARANLAAWRPFCGQLRAVFSHKGPVIGAAFSPDGRAVISASEDGTAQLWDVTSGMSIGPPLSHENNVNAVAFSPDGSTALTGSEDSTAQLWNAKTGEPIGSRLRHEAPVLSVAFHPGGKMVLTGAGDKTARLWDTATGRLISPPLVHEHNVASLAFSPDGKTMVLRGSDGSSRLWDVPSLQPIGAVPKPARLVVFSPEGKTVFLEPAPGQTGQPDGRLMGFGGAAVISAISPDARTLVTGSGYPTVRLWDTTTRKVFGLPLQHQSDPRAAAFSPDGRTLVTSSREKKARLWDAATGMFLGILEHQGPIVSLAFSPDGKTILTASEDGTARLWDAGWRPPVMQSVDIPTDDPVSMLSPDLGAAVSWREGSDGRHIRIWNVTTGRATGPELQLPGGANLEIGRDGKPLLFSPDGKTLLVLLSDRIIRLVDVSTNTPLGPRHEQPGPIECVTFSPDSKAILFGGWDGAAWIWDIPTARLRGKIPVQRRSVDAVAWSLDGRTFAIGLDLAEVQVWDAATFTPLGKPIPHPGAVGGVQFSPSGTTILISGEDGTARLWDLAKREPCIPPLVHEGGYIWGLAFSPDGKTIATAGDDKVVRLWDAGTGQPIGPTLKREYPAQRARFVTDGSRLITSDLRTFRIFPIPTPLPDEPDRLWAWVEALTGLTLEPRQGLVQVLDNTAWLERRDRLIQLGGPPETGTEQRLDPILLGPYPMARARTFLEREQWDAAAAALDEALRARAFNLSIIRQRGDLYARLGLWSEAVAFYASKVSEYPDAAPLKDQFLLLLEKRENESHTRWKVLRPTEMKSAGGATLTKLADESILAGGAHPPSDQYTVVFTVPERMEFRSIRLEALLHNSLPGNGPGRSTKNYVGVFALDRWDLTAKRPDSAGSSRRLSFFAASADYSWNNAPLGLQGEWNISFGEGKPHSSVWRLKAPITLEAGSEIVSHMRFNALRDWSDQNLGRFRISVCTQPTEFEPEEIGLAAVKLKDPWGKLAVAYRVIGDQRALERLLKDHPEAASGVGDLYAASQDWERAIAEYRKRLTDASADVALLRKLAWAYESAGCTREALPLLAKAYAANPKDTVFAGTVAARQAWFGQEKELAATRERIQAFAKGTNDSGVAERSAKVCSIVPYTDKVQLEASLALARKGVELGKGRDWPDWNLLALGMAEYRIGNYAAALEALAAAEQAGPNVTAISGFYRAMSLFRQGKKEQARKVAIAAAAKMKPLPADEQNPLIGDVGDNDLIAWLAYKEAKAMIQFDAGAPPKAKNDKN